MDITPGIDEKKIIKHELHELHKVWGLTRKDFTEILGAEIVALTGGLLAGTALALFSNNIALVPALFIALPGFLEMRGAVGGSLSARLSSALFLGVMKPTAKGHILRGNVFATFVLALFGSLAIGVVAYVLELFLLGINFPQIVYITFIAAIISNFIEIPLVALLTFALFHRGVDPSNVMGPYATTISDIVSVLSILAAVVIIL